MKAKIYAFLLSKSGWLVKVPVGALVAFLTTQFQRIGIELTDEQQIAATTTITGIVIALLESLLRAPDDKNKVIVQSELGVTRDGYYGPETVKAAKRIKAQPTEEKKPRKRYRTGLKHQSRP